MTQEDKQLLLVDLSTRLPYGVKFNYGGYDGCDYKVVIITSTFINDFPIEDCKPYLRPMSSMTEEECDMVEEILGDKCIFDFMSNGDIVLKQGQFSQNKLAKLYDYYTSIHVDYRGLIPKGLALEAPEGMYNLNK